MSLERVPETNSFGLVLPPTSDELEYLSLQAPNNRHNGVDRHHLYWPRSLYLTSPLAKKFREHEFNSIWLMRHDHDNIHRHYDGVPFPPRTVMKAFLEEAELLEGLGISMRAVEMIDTAIYEGRLRNEAMGHANRSYHLEVIQQSLDRAARLEVVPQIVASMAVTKALNFAETQAA